MTSSHRARARLRTTPLALVTGLVAASLVALTMSGTLSAFSASITNSQNTAATGTLLMEESSTGKTTCTSSPASTVSSSNANASCTSINKFGGSTQMTPGTTVTTDVVIKNTGTLAASTFTLLPAGTCQRGTNGSTNGTASDICAKMTVVIKTGTSQVFSGTLAALGTATPASFTNIPSTVAAGSSVPFTFAVTLDPGATNDYQGLSASVPLTWTFTA
ncbi:hypothetical protein ACPEEZ_00825 [Frigoribacterium sp. 2-23]|uniref:hypothetical protein n=1 Tax=Frigoribacterium sp. 2-23 TaxID=3415006 RepID=UPI003C6FB6D6